MKVNLNLEEYCTNCPEFEYKVTQTRLYGDNSSFENKLYITCEHQRICQRIRKYLENVKDDDLK